MGMCIIYAYNSGWECGTPTNFHFLIEQFFVNKYKDILKYSEMFLNRYEMQDWLSAMQLKSVAPSLLYVTSQR